MKQAEIIVRRKKDEFEILDWHNVARRKNLPREYLDGYPHFYEDHATDGVYIELIESKLFGWHLVKNSRTNQINKSELNHIIHVMKHAGHRLSKILKQPQEFTIKI